MDSPHINNTFDSMLTHKYEWPQAGTHSSGITALTKPVNEVSSGTKMLMPKSVQPIECQLKKLSYIPCLHVYQCVIVTAQHDKTIHIVSIT